MRSMGGKYCNRSRVKLNFKGSSGKDYGTHGLNQSHKLYHSIRLNFSTWRFCQKLHGVSPRGQKVPFFHLVRASGWMLSFFSSTIFSTQLNRLKWNWKPIISLTKWSADYFFGIYRSTNLSTLFQYFFSFF